MNSTVVYLIGHSGVGKYTIAKALAAGGGLRLVDNHLINNVIFSLVRADGTSAMPDRVWDLVAAVRAQALTAIAEVAPREWSYVFTNALVDDPWDRAAYAEVKGLAERRNSVFVPVVLTCSDAAFAARIGNADRDAQMKWTDAKAAADLRAKKAVLHIEHPNRLDLDTTDLSPEASAAAIRSHIEDLSS